MNMMQLKYVPIIGLSDETGMVSDTVFRNTVNERRIVTPGIYRLCYFKSFPDLCFLSNILLVLPVYIRMGLSMSLSHSNII
jgi:hypothetical protein